MTTTAAHPTGAAARATTTARWTRRSPMGGGGRHRERWERWSGGDLTGAADVDVTVGKPLDVRRLRGIDCDGTRAYLDELRAAADGLRGVPAAVRPDCPCCGAPSEDAPAEVRVTGIAYHRCPACGHLYVRAQPAPEALARRFAESDELAGVYTDRASLEVRMDQVVRPKMRWVGEVSARYARGAATLADLGAGGGHFVAAAREAGAEARGYEISRASCAFARDVLGVDLVHGDVMDAAPAPVDVVTLWGVLEYVPEPRDLVRHAARFLAPGGLLVAEVPRADALSSALQGAFPHTVARHLEPTSHLNVFSDASLATLLWDAGFRPVAAWYFGMDAFELVTQLALRVGEEAAEALAPPLLALQPALDRALLCDDVIVAAVRR